MSAVIQENDRHIYPRWRSFGSTLQLGELARPASEVEIDTASLDLSLARGIADWQQDPKLWRGLDLLGTVMVTGRLDAFPALIAEIQRNPSAPRFIGKMLERLQKPTEAPPDEESGVETPSASSLSKEIRDHRSRLITSPRDPIEWIELARAYTITGANKKAERAVRAALQLAPNNRYVLRSAARFLIHIGEKEQAQRLLNRAPVSKFDPWLMASEIAIADSLGRPSKLAKDGRGKIESDLPPSELTELASALGSLEAENGNHRMARRFLRRALVNANENSVAQIQWLNRKHLNDAIDVSDANPPLLHEAKAWDAFHRYDFGIARKEALGWLEDQPFASAPAGLSSYIVSEIFLDFKHGKEIALAGLRSNPDDPLLLNNLAVCQMELSELDDAEASLSRIRDDTGTKKDVIYEATFGMLAFRMGKAEEGRRLYIEAIEKARSNSDKGTATRAAFHLAFEEIVANSSHVDEAIARIRELAVHSDLSAWSSFFDRVKALRDAKQTRPNS